MACSRASITVPGSIGSTTTSPGASRENDTRPGPWATLSTNGMPDSSRCFMPPGVSITDMAVASSFHSITWCSKNSASPAPSSTSTTGTTVPSTWATDADQRISVRSRICGACRQPASLTTLRMSSGAPHRSHVVADAGLCPRHQRHWMRWEVSVTPGTLLLRADRLPAEGLVADRDVRLALDLRVEDADLRLALLGGEVDGGQQPVAVVVVEALHGLDVLRPVGARRPEQLQALDEQVRRQPPDQRHLPDEGGRLVLGHVGLVLLVAGEVELEGCELRAEEVALEV